MKFTEFNFHPDLLKGINGADFINCTEIQEKTFEIALENIDIFGQSQTGTGKTAAFLITIFQLFLSDKISQKKAFILVPTRELAVQIEEEAKLLGKYLNFKIASFYGGVGYFKQEDLLKKGVDLIIGTPGRLIDFCKSKKMNLSEIGVLVIDEADRMFDMGFIPDIRFLIGKMPAQNKRRTMLFSATLPGRVRDLAWEYLKDPKEITIAPDSITVDTVTQVLYHVGTVDKIKLLLGILNKEKPESVIVFANTKHIVEEISKRLEINGISNQFIIGDLPQRKRLRIINDVKSGKIKFLIATDVAARGLHVDDLDLVINYDLPEDSENYIHRIGRTARAGKSGKAISLVCEKYVYGLEAIEKYASIKIPVIWPDEDLFGEDKSAGTTILNKNRVGRHPDKRKSTKKPYKKDYPERKPRQVATAYSSEKKITRDRDKDKDNDNDNDNDKDKNKNSKFLNKKYKSLKNGSIEDRIKYYKEKYGEQFTVTPEMSSADKKRKVDKTSLLRRLFGIFKKK